MISPATYEVLLGLAARRLPVAVLILANLFPLYAVWRGDWDVGALVILYWAENLIIGFYSLLKILLAGLGSVPHLLANGFAALFFVIHFGGFVGVHGFFVALFFPLGAEPITLDSLSWPFLLVFPEILWRVVLYMWANMPPLMLGGVLLLFASHGVSFVFHYLVRGEATVASGREQMAAPYGRIVVMHITIIAGAFFVEALGSTLPILVILILLKIGLDTGFHLRSHRKLERKAAASGQPLAGIPRRRAVRDYAIQHPPIKGDK